MRFLIAFIMSCSLMLSVASADEAVLKFEFEDRTLAFPTSDILNVEIAETSFGDMAVSFEFSQYYKRAFADATAANIGQKFRIILCGDVISEPVVGSPITGGRGLISGSQSRSEATELAKYLKTGKCD